MSTISIENQPTQERLEELGVTNWPIWEKEESEFRWKYDCDETCYILEGEVMVTPDGGEPVHIKEGDLVLFPTGMSCKWKVLKAIRKHFLFA